MMPELASWISVYPKKKLTRWSLSCLRPIAVAETPCTEKEQDN